MRTMHTHSGADTTFSGQDQQTSELGGERSPLRSGGPHASLLGRGQDVRLGGFWFFSHAKVGGGWGSAYHVFHYEKYFSAPVK